jgi:hypothetical protein
MNDLDGRERPCGFVNEYGPRQGLKPLQEPGDGLQDRLPWIEAFYVAFAFVSA